MIKSGYLLKTIFLLFLGTAMNPNPLHAQLDIGLTPMENTVKRDKKHAFEIFKDDDPVQITNHAKAVFELTPRLRPERLVRRMKMLWGLDLNDYPEDCLINLGGDRSVGFYFFNPRMGIIWMKTYQDDPVMGFDIPESFPPEKYALSYRYMMMDDVEALHESYRKYDYTEMEDNMYDINFIADGYCNAIFDAGRSMIECRDSLNNVLLIGHGYYYPPFYSKRRLDAILLYTKQEMKKGRKLYFSKYDKPRDMEKTGNDIYLQSDPFYPPSKVQTPLTLFLIGEANNPWYPILTGESVTAAWLSFQLSLNIDSVNNKIVRDLYKKYDTSRTMNMDRLKKALKDNNYYGHAILREFLTNPMREIPTLEKIGTGFKARIKEENTPLLLEPVAVSFDIDTVYPDEIFKAYEMGHDNYYFIEIEKPVESPVADEDGYAMIIDRLETVYGYLPKEQVKAHASRDVSEESRYNDRALSYTGVIQDKDGYVNIRKEPNSQSEIVGKIADKEVFRYWKTESNWYIVETEEGIRGFVYKDRIREKYDENINLPNEGDEELPEI